MSLSAHASLLSPRSHGSATGGVTTQPLHSPRIISGTRDFTSELNATTAQSQPTSSTSQTISSNGQGSLLNALYSALSASHAHNETNSAASAVTYMQTGIKTADTF
ncbi:hypothetical protein [Brytella acorum]|uniref:Uncharacterized protein n=1 Tax=Brytella acorum TaxID=2959299 RepID=A0AA35UZY6_9PROT|nr:hypothetical protein [Brytella acorum]MDF3624847.1 hypothetical protein [Brytella acorum]CAI9120150.1 hypothetical protein LMG32879_000979 [Brytella acorum]